MKLVTFSTKFATTPTAGVLIGNEIVDLSSFGYHSVLSLIQCGQPALAAISVKLPNAPRIPFETVTLHAPIPRPPRIFGIGLNYQKHADESKMPVQKVPTVFMKLTSSVVGPDHPIILPKLSEQPDYEAEFGGRSENLSPPSHPPAQPSPPPTKSPTPTASVSPSLSTAKPSRIRTPATSSSRSLPSSPTSPAPHPSKPETSSAPELLKA
jgi:hypothetical protein